MHGWWLPETEGKAPDVPMIDGEEGTFVKVRKRNWARLISKVWKDDPTLCEGCGQPMKIIAAISSPEQDEVIEKILRSRREWDPPWFRQRKARGPPADGAFAPPPETRIEYDPGYEPGMESWNGEVDPDWGWE